MWAFIIKWAANKLVVAFVAILALCGTIFTPVAIYQAFEINGYQILWWGAPGLKTKLATAQADLKLSRDNTDMIQKGLDKCNASVIGMDAAAKRGQAESAKRIATLQTERDRLKANRANGDSAPSSAQVCPSVDAVMGEYSK